jgi:hypothetical protein
MAMRSLGAFAPPLPKTEAGTIIGAAAAVAANPARLRKLLREMAGFEDLRFIFM